MSRAESTDVGPEKGGAQWDAPAERAPQRTGRGGPRPEKDKSTANRSVCFGCSVLFSVLLKNFDSSMYSLSLKNSL